MTRDSSPSRSLRLFTLTVILLGGIMTGAQLGKVAPLIPWYQGEMGLSLVATGWLASILGVFIAMVALPAGWAVGHLGIIRSILIGTVALVGGGLLLASAETTTLIFAARLIEAVGYLALCIALPAALNAICLPEWKAPALAIWSGFVPIGFAVADLLAGAMLPVVDPQTFLTAITLIFGALNLAVLILLQSMSGTIAITAANRGGLRPTLAMGTILLALSFGAYVVLSVAVLNFLPTFVALEGQHYLLPAGAILLMVPVGNVLASILVRGKSAAYISRVTIAGFVICIIVAIPAFMMANPLVATLGAIIIIVAGGLVASAQFAAIPFLTPARGSVPVALGLVSQIGGIGTIFGPPLAAFVIENYGWTGFAWFLIVCGIAGLACLIPLSVERPSPLH